MLKDSTLLEVFEGFLTAVNIDYTNNLPNRKCPSSASF